MIQKTTNYDLFKFRDDNRVKIDQAHIRKLMDSITARNLLELRPIMVNEKLEIIDGQHRLHAAKNLSVEIYYQIQQNLEASDIILMNVTKTWSMADYLNFHCHNQKDEYIKLKNFMDKHNIGVRVAYNMSCGNSKVSEESFKHGDFKFSMNEMEKVVEICWETIGYIKKINGRSAYTQSVKFWGALLKVIKHPEFRHEKWKSNLEKLIYKCGPKNGERDYIIMLQGIYNWKNHTRLDLAQEIGFE